MTDPTFAATMPRLPIFTRSSLLRWQLLEHEHATLVAPVHACLEVGTRTAALEYEHQPQHVLVEQRDVARVDVELRGEVEQGGGAWMKACRDVDELRCHPNHIGDRLFHLQYGQ